MTKSQFIKVVTEGTAFRQKAAVALWKRNRETLSKIKTNNTQQNL